MSRASDPSSSDAPGQAPRDSTRALLEALKAEPDRAWEGVLRSVQSRLRVLLSFRMDARLRAMADEEDVLQEVWLQAMAGLSRFQYRGPGSLQRWMSGILRNKLRELARQGERQVTAAGDEARAATGGDAGLLELLDRTQPSVSRTARQREVEERVQAVLETLPELEREALLLRVYEGLSVREAAEVAGVDASTISLRTNRALKRCALRLKELEP